jgi:DNA invertase Pin-like site-specific DNA recombinase
MFRAGLYARVSPNDQQTFAMQSRAMREYAARRGWTVDVQVREVSSGAAKREAREKLLDAARRRRARMAAGSLGSVGNGSEYRNQMCSNKGAHN